MPFDTALRLLLNASQPRLTHTRENGVYVFKAPPAEPERVDARLIALQKRLMQLTDRKVQLASVFKPESAPMQNVEREIQEVEAQLNLRLQAR